MREFVDKHFSKELAELADEQLKMEFYHTLTQVTQSHRLNRSGASKQLLTDLSFMSGGRDSESNQSSSHLA